MDMILKRVLDIQLFMKVTYGAVPIIAGADKVTNFLTNWSEYLNPMLLEILPVSDKSFMIGVGIIEIAAGVMVLLRPAVGAYIVCGWLVLISLSLLLSGHYLDVAVRDMVMAIGAFTLGQLSTLVSPVKEGQS